MKKQPELKEEYLVQMRNMGMPEDHQNWMVIRDPNNISKMYAQTLEEAQIRLDTQKRYVNRNNKSYSVGGGLAASIESDTEDKYEFRIRKRMVTPWETVKEES